MLFSRTFVRELINMFLLFVDNNSPIANDKYSDHCKVSEKCMSCKEREQSKLQLPGSKADAKNINFIEKSLLLCLIGYNGLCHAQKFDHFVQSQFGSQIQTLLSGVLTLYLYIILKKGWEVEQRFDQESEQLHYFSFDKFGPSFTIFKT